MSPSKFGKSSLVPQLMHEKSGPLPVRQPSARRKDPGTPLAEGGNNADRMGLRVDSGRKPWSTVRHAVQRIALPRVTFQIWGFKSGAATLVMKNHDRYLSADLLRGGRIPELVWPRAETLWKE